MQTQSTQQPHANSAARGTTLLELGQSATAFPIPHDYDQQPDATRLPNTALPTSVPDKPPYLWMLITIVTAAGLSGAMLFLAVRTEPAPIVLHPPPTPAPTTTPLPTPTPAPFKVFVSGAVQKPGVYNVPADARVADALALAGGLLAEADAAQVNQAEQLWDGVQVHVPSAAAEAAINEPPPGVSGTSPPLQGRSGLGKSSNGQININTATQAELMTLSGVGERKAEDIIAGRPYQSVDELERVSGIGAKTVEKLREFVTAD